MSAPLRRKNIVFIHRDPLVASIRHSDSVLSDVNTTSPQHGIEATVSPRTEDKTLSSEHSGASSSPASRQISATVTEEKARAPAIVIETPKPAEQSNVEEQPRRKNTLD